MLQSFSALIEQLESAQAKARGSALVNETAETASNAIGTQFERIRIESGKERDAARLREEGVTTWTKPPMRC